MKTKILDLIIKTDKSEKNVKNLNKDLKETQGDLSGVENMADKATGGLVSGFKGVTSSIGGVVKGFKSMRMAIIATGIGALVLVVSSLMAAFTSSEQGANKFNKILGVLGAIVDNFIDLLADLGETLISIFENPKEALKSFANLLKDQIVNRITGLLELLPALGKAVQLVFKGEFSEAGKVATNAVGKVALGVENVTDKIKAATEATKEFIQENIKDAEGAAKVADMRAKATKLERELLVQRSKLESEIALLRLKSRQEEEFSATERAQALRDAQKLEDELLDKETKVLTLRRDAQVEENTFARSSVENLDKEANAIAAVNRIAAQRANVARQVQRELNTINKQIEAENKRIANEQKAIDDAKLAADKKATDEKLKIAREEATKIAEAKKEFELKEIERKKEAVRLLGELSRTEMEQELFLLNEKFLKEMAIAKGNNELELILKQEHTDQIKAIEDSYREDKKIKNDELREQERLADIEAVDKGLDYAAQSLNAIQELGNAVFAHKLKNLEKGSKEEEKVARKAFNFNKALQLGMAIIDTGKAITASLAMAPVAIGPVPNPAGIASLAFASISGAAQIAMIAAQKYQPSKTSGKPASTSSAGGASGGGGGAPQTGGASQAPSFNVVGQSGFNQVAGALGNQPPVQAFVVAGAVTNAQQLQNNTINQATF